MPSPPSSSSHTPSRRAFLAGSAGAVVAVGASKPAAAYAARRQGSSTAAAGIEAFGDYPRSLFFRRAEYLGLNLKVPYEQLAAELSALNGTIDKVTGEEIGARPELAAMMRRFKAEHPSKLVLAHLNGAARAPDGSVAAGYFAGHWLYHPGTTLQQPVTASAEDTVLHVADTSVFRLDAGRFKDHPDNIGIARVGADGKVDWLRAEQVVLVSIDVEASTITVQRGQFDTEPLDWPAGTYLAPHVIRGPFGSARANFPMLWAFNYSTVCPRNADGHTCGDVFVADLARQFAAGGELEGFDGLEFDVLPFTMVEAPATRPGLVDVDSDGIGDNGVVDGVNVYGLGTEEFFAKLRNALPTKVLLADGQKLLVRVPGAPNYSTQRGFGLLNGAETEGFLALTDHEVTAWSEGINILRFWVANCPDPAFSYVNVKRRPVPDPANLPYPWYRIIFAATTLSGAAIAQLDAPPDPAREVGIFDELQRGTAHQTNWLGKPVGAPVHAAERTGDILHGQGVAWTAELIRRFTGEGVRFDRRTGQGQPPRLVITGTDHSPSEMVFHLTGIESSDEDLVVMLDVSVAPLPEYPSSVGRSLQCTATGTTTQTAQATWTNQRQFAALFYHRGIGTGPVDLQFSVEGTEPVTFHRLRAFSAQDATYQEYEHGAVFANPSTRPFTFQLDELLPNRSFRRLAGSVEQDPATNNGQQLGSQLTIGPIDALFVERANS